MNAGDSKEAFRAGVKEHEVSWPCAWQGEKESPVSRLFRVSAYPTVMVLDAEGRIRHRNLKGAALARAIERLLAEARAPAEKGK